MFSPRLLTATLAVIGSAALGGCASYYDPYSGYGSGISIGYGNGYYGYDPYGYYGNRYYGSRYYGGRYYGGYGYRPYYGWYDNYYYPGTGIYVYDRYRRAHRWNDRQRRYWQDRRDLRRSETTGQNWHDFRRDRIRDERNFRVERRDDRRALRQGQITREQFRQDRQQDRREFRRERRQDRRELRRNVRDD